MGSGGAEYCRDGQFMFILPEKISRLTISKPFRSSAVATQCAGNSVGASNSSSRSGDAVLRLRRALSRSRSRSRSRNQSRRREEILV